MSFLENIHKETRSVKLQTAKRIIQVLRRWRFNQAELSRTIAHNLPQLNGPSQLQLFIDVSQIVHSDYKTGIQRVVRALILEFLRIGLEDFRVEPVWLSSTGGRWHYCYARRWTQELLGIEQSGLQDEAIETRQGDVLLLADLTGGYVIEADKCGVYTELAAEGVDLKAIVYDILPMVLPQCFPEGFDASHAKWLTVLANRASTLLCISKAVAHETTDWLARHQPSVADKVKIKHFHLGADLENTSPTHGLPKNHAELKSQLAQGCSFLMIGTVEPRKGYAQAIKAFEHLLHRGHCFNLVIIGKVGWMVEDLIESMTRSQLMNKSIFWFDSGSDEFVRWLYQHCQCLIAASQGEGFGLPLIEAAVYELPIIARDLPVFREVAGSNAYYFEGLEADDLAAAIEKWHQQYQVGTHPASSGIEWMTWNQSARLLLQEMKIRVPT